MSDRDVYRMEVRFPRATVHDLKLLQKEVQAKTGKHVPVGELVSSIVNQFFDKSKKVNEMKKDHLLSTNEEVQIAQQTKKGTTSFSPTTKEGSHAEGTVRPDEDEGAAGR